MKAPGFTRDRLLAEIAGRPSPTRGEVQRSGRIVAALAAVLLVAFGASKGLPWNDARPLDFVVVTGSLLLTVAAVATTLWLRHRSAARLPPARLRLAAAAATAAVLASSFVASSVHLGGSAPGSAHLACGASVASVGLGLTWLLLRRRRGSDPVGPAATGATIAGVVAAWTAVGVHARCGYADGVHATFAHALPVVFLVFAGAMVGHRWLPPRALLHDPQRARPGSPALR